MRPRKQAERSEALNQNPSPRDTKEQVWLVGRIEPPAEFMKGRAVWLYDPANPTEYPDYGDRLIPLTTAKEQAEADYEAIEKACADRDELRRRWEQAESERDTALEAMREAIAWCEQEAGEEDQAAEKTAGEGYTECVGAAKAFRNAADHLRAALDTEAKRDIE